MISMEDIYNHRNAILTLAHRHGAQNVRVFGSVVHDQTGPDSDIDFLVTMDDNRSLLDHIALIRELEKLLGCPVDVVSDAALHPSIREHVLAEGVAL